MVRVSVFILSLLFTTPLHAAELWLREALVKKHANDILISIQAAPDHIGKQARPIERDCNLHVPLRSDDIKVALLGKIKNACSFPYGVPATHWSRKLKPLEGKRLEVQGVLRVWLDHAPEGGKRQCECDRLPDYTDSDPYHMVELHPLTAMGGISFLEMTRDVQKGDTPYIGHRGGKLPSTLNQMKISVRRIKRAGEAYISIRGSRSRYSDWTVLAVVMGVAERRKGGHAFEVAVVHRDGLLAENLRGLTIEGTAADREVENLEVNDEVVLSGLMRLDLAWIDREAGETWKTIPMPYEMVVLNIMR